MSNMLRLRRYIRRDLLSGSVLLMALAILVSITAVSSVSLLAERVEGALLGDAQASLGADRVLISGREPSPDWLDLARDLGLTARKGAIFPSTVLEGEQFSLVSVKAVGEGYPLRGELLLRNPAGELVSAGGLGLQDAWVDPELLARLGVQVGDSFQLGDRRFQIAGVIGVEPDRGFGFLSLSPRVMIREEALASTGLIQPGSRISYRLWVAGDDLEALKAFDERIEPLLGQGDRFETLENARPEVRAALDRAGGFLSITSMMSVITAAAAMVLAARQLGRVQAPRIAVLKTLGASGRVLVGYWLGVLGGVVVAASLLGVALGWLLQLVLAGLLESLLNTALPTSGFPLRPLLQGLALSVAMALVFAGPAIWQAIRIPAVASLRSAEEAQPLWSPGSSAGLLAMGKSLLGFALMGVGLVGILWLGGGSLELAFLVAVGFLAMAGLLWGGLAVLYRGIGTAVPARLVRGSWTLLALRRSLIRRPRALAAQSTGLALALGALFLLTVLQGDLVDAWSRTMPDDAPNRFVLNILPEDEKPFLETLRQAGVTAELAPLVRGRLVERNGQPFGPDDAREPRGRGFLDRELNLSYARAIPVHNTLVEGRPLDPLQPEVSLEKGFAESLGLKLGDELVFDAAGDRLAARVTSLRTLRWDSFEVNFFLVFSPAVVRDEARTAITSFYVPPDRAAELGQQLMSRFPSLTLVETDAILQQLRGVLTQVVTAIQGLFGFSLLAGGLVVWASQRASRPERLREASLLRALGAGRSRLFQAQLLEFAVVGGLAGLAAALTAQLLGQQLALQVFSLEMPLRLAPLVWGALLGALVTLLAGLSTLLKVLRTPSIAALRPGANFTS